jgi:hypothetical protein
MAEHRMFTLAEFCERMERAGLYDWIADPVPDLFTFTPPETRPMDSPIPRYYELLHEAHAASAALDDFDLHSEDPVSQARFNALQAINRVRQGALVGFVAAFSCDLHSTLTMPTEPPMDSLYSQALKFFEGAFFCPPVAHVPGALRPISFMIDGLAHLPISPGAAERTLQRTWGNAVRKLPEVGVAPYQPVWAIHGDGAQLHLVVAREQNAEMVTQALAKLAHPEDVHPFADRVVGAALHGGDLPHEGATGWENHAVAQTVGGPLLHHRDRGAASILLHPKDGPAASQALQQGESVTDVAARFGGTVLHQGDDGSLTPKSGREVMDRLHDDDVLEEVRASGAFWDTANGLIQGEKDMAYFHEGVESVGKVMGAGNDPPWGDLAPGEFLQAVGTDGHKWASAFMGIMSVNPTRPADEADMIGWFANAIEAGREAGRKTATLRWYDIVNDELRDVTMEDVNRWQAESAAYHMTRHAMEAVAAATLAVSQGITRPWPLGRAIRERTPNPIRPAPNSAD